MKKFLFYILSACILIGCKEKITVKGADGVEYESYQEACMAADFQAAHQYLSKMQSNDLAERLYAADYVFKQEALFLMSQGNETAKKRLLYLLKEEGYLLEEVGSYNKHVAMLIDLAIEEDDTTFIKQLANQYTASAASEDLRTVTNYMLSSSNSDCQKFVKNLLKKLKREEILLDFAIDQNDKVYIDEYLSTNELRIYDDNLLKYMATQKEKKYSDKIISMLVEKEGSIGKKPKMGTTRFDGTGQCTYEFEEMCKRYQSDVKNFNEDCQTVLSIAINSSNSYLAQRAVSKFKTNIHVEDLGWTNEHTYTYKITSDNEDIQQAQKTYREAFKSGSFK